MDIKRLEEFPLLLHMGACKERLYTDHCPSCFKKVSSCPPLSLYNKWLNFDLRSSQNFKNTCTVEKEVVQLGHHLTRFVMFLLYFLCFYVYIVILS